MLSIAVTPNDKSRRIHGCYLQDHVVCSRFLHKVSLVRWQHSHTPTKILLRLEIVLYFPFLAILKIKPQSRIV